MEPKVAVLLPVYNEEPYIVEALESIREQSYRNWVCSIVNDGSTDATARLVTEFIKGDDRFIFEDKNINEGIAKTINKSAKNAFKAGADYLLVFGADDVMLPDCVQTAVGRIGPADFLQFSYQQFQDGSGIVVPPFHGTWQSMFSSGSFSGYVMYKSSVWKKLRGYDEETFLPVSKSSYEDWDLAIRALKENCTYDILIEPKIKHRWHSGQETRQNMQVLSELQSLMSNKHIDHML